MNGYRYMTLADRQALESLYLKGERIQDIADQIGVHVATVYKELKRGETGELDRNMRREYSAMLAQRRLAENIKKRGKKNRGHQPDRTGRSNKHIAGPERRHQHGKHQQFQI